MRKTRILAAAALALLVLGWGARIYTLRQMQNWSPPPGPRAGRLADCPDKPNCVSTQATEPQHAIEPLAYRGTAAQALDHVAAVVSQFPRAKVVRRDDQYLHAEFKSWLFGFVDDVEFLVDEAAQQIHFRSASRLGHSDLGVNRKRMETFRQRFAALAGE